MIAVEPSKLILNINFFNVLQNHRNIYVMTVTMGLDLLSLHYENKSIILPDNVIKYNVILRITLIIIITIII